MTRSRKRFVVSLVILLAIAAAIVLVDSRSRKSAFAKASPLSERRSAASSVLSASGQFMTLDPSGRFVINSITNKPVFIVGDDAWALITQLDNSDVDLYLSDRAAKGFNYIWCGAVDNDAQADAPKNHFGDSPFDGPDFTNEDPKYWAHVDYVLQRAQTYGITVALDPAFVGLSFPGGYLPSYQKSSDATMAAYGAFLGDRYKSSPNLIWALGGDVDPSTGVVPKLTALANGIRSKDTVHLIVAEGHPRAAALDTFQGVSWMNLNWLYFHSTDVLPGVPLNYARDPFLPPFLGEGWYENEHGISALMLREQAYWSVLGGADLGNAGFGNNPLWYFNAAHIRKPGEPSWKDQLSSQGSLSQMYLGRLFRSREHWKLVPDLDHQVMTAGYDSRGPIDAFRESLRSTAHNQPYRLGELSSVAARTSDGQTVIAYVPNGNATSISIDLRKIEDKESQAKCWWFNPRNGIAQVIGVFPTTAPRTFTPLDPKDWVLVVDSLTAQLPAPGTKDL